MPGEVMTVEEVAAYLGLSADTIYTKVSRREIPFTKIGNLLRFPKPIIDRWLAENANYPHRTLYDEFVRMANRYFFEKWLEGRGLSAGTVSDDQLMTAARAALEDLREHGPTPGEGTAGVPSA